MVRLCVCGCVTIHVQRCGGEFMYAVTHARKMWYMPLGGAIQGHNEGAQEREN